MTPPETTGLPGQAPAGPPDALPARAVGWGVSALLHGAVAAFLLAGPLPSPSAQGPVEIALANAAGLAGGTEAGAEGGGAEADPAPLAEPPEAPAIEEAVRQDTPPEDVPVPLAETAEPVMPETAELAPPETLAVARALPPPPPAAPPRPRPAVARPARGPIQAASAAVPSGGAVDGASPGPSTGEGAAGDASPGPAGAGAAGAAAAPAAGGGAREGLPPSYQALLQRILRRAHRVPEAAREARISGTALVHAVIARDGRVLHHHIHRSSGSPILDGEALALFARVSPFPPIPESYLPPVVRIDVPVEFRVVW